MKKWTSFLILTLSCFSVQSQDWRVFNQQNDTLSFISYDTIYTLENVIWSVYPDSVDFQPTSITYYLNEMIGEPLHDTLCEYSAFSSTPLGKKITQTDSLITFHFHQSSFMFSKSDTVQHNFPGYYYRTYLNGYQWLLLANGQWDSVMTFTYEYQILDPNFTIPVFIETLILSKNNGLIKVPDFNYTNAYPSGIPLLTNSLMTYNNTRYFNFKIPTQDEIFDFQIGTILHYKHTETRQSAPVDNCLINREIIDVITQPTFKTFIAYEHKMCEKWKFIGGMLGYERDTIYYSDTINFSISLNHLISDYLSWNINTFFYPFYFEFGEFYLSENNNLSFIQASLFGSLDTSTECIYIPSTFGLWGYQTINKYEKGLGKILEGKYEYNGQHYFFDELKLIYIKNDTIEIGTASYIGTDDFSVQSKMNIFPNPANEALFITGLNDSKNTNYTVFDLSGRILLNGTLEKGSDTYKLDITSLNKGLYILNIENQINKKFLKM